MDSARGGVGGAIDSLDSAEERRGESDICGGRLTTSSSKHTLRRSSTGESANVTDFDGTVLVVAALATAAGLPLTPLTAPLAQPFAYGGGDLYGGALMDGLIDLA